MGFLGIFGQWIFNEELDLVSIGTTVVFGWNVVKLLDLSGCATHFCYSTFIGNNQEVFIRIILFQVIFNSLYRVGECIIQNWVFGTLDLRLSITTFTVFIYSQEIRSQNRSIMSSRYSSGNPK